MVGVVGYGVDFIVLKGAEHKSWFVSLVLHGYASMNLTNNPNLDLNSITRKTDSQQNPPLWVHKQTPSRPCTVLLETPRERYKDGMCLPVNMARETYRITLPSHQNDETPQLLDIMRFTYVYAFLRQFNMLMQLEP
ncbi:hypothetical protein Y032_0002g970 [Ancylostoma ceylanicum]|nr:hypothetical protein Y032_0002g970 [Ancylostoma ceylanicum]